jgi:hypothetical protein
MLKKIMLLILSVMFMMSLCGCVALFAGVAGGVGTTVWLSGKLTQEFHSPYHATIDATKASLQSLNIPITKETDEEEMTQIKGSYSDGREMWIDIHKVTENSTKVEVRVGGVNSDKEAASKILKTIQSYL